MEELKCLKPSPGTTPHHGRHTVGRTWQQSSLARGERDGQLWGELHQVDTIVTTETSTEAGPSPPF